MSATAVTKTSGLILALVILAWHVFPQAMNGGYPHYTPLFYALLTVAWFALVTLIGGLFRIMTAR